MGCKGSKSGQLKPLKIIKKIPIAKEVETKKSEVLTLKDVFLSKDGSQKMESHIFRYNSKIFMQIKEINGIVKKEDDLVSVGLSLCIKNQSGNFIYILFFLKLLIFFLYFFSLEKKRKKN